MRPIVLLLAVLLTVACFRADGAKMEPEEMSVVDLLTAMNAHFCKWSYQPEKPYTQLTFRFNYFTRTPSLVDRFKAAQEGEFWRRTFHESTIHFGEDSHQHDDIIIYLKSSDYGEVLLHYGVAGGSAGISLPNSFSQNVYQPFGGGRGGLPLVIGSEYILAGHSINDKYPSDRKGLADYISVEITSE